MGCHLDVRKLGEAVDDPIDESIGLIVQLGVRFEIGKRQHRNRTNALLTGRTCRRLPPSIDGDRCSGNQDQSHGRRG
jgi:hypothetical protein